MRPIFLGFSCNSSCIFCAQGSLRIAGQPVPDAAVLEAVQGGSDVAFMGGEPTLREDLPRLIKTAKDAGARWVLLQTNGRRLIYPDYVKALKEAGLDACEVALYGSTAPMHDYHTAAPG